MSEEEAAQAPPEPVTKKDLSIIARNLSIAAIIATIGAFVDLQVLKADFVNAKESQEKSLTGQKELLELKLKNQGDDLSEIKTDIKDIKKLLMNLKSN